MRPIWRWSQPASVISATSRIFNAGLRTAYGSAGVLRATIDKLPLRALTLDIGNSRTKAAFFVDGELREPVLDLTDADRWAALDREATNLGVSNVIYSTVANVPPAAFLDRWTARKWTVVALSDLEELPFPSVYETPRTLGQDRQAVVAAARRLGRLPALVVDAGTCVTFDLVDAGGVYRGGNISPGLRMRLTAMHEYTRRLPRVAIAAPRDRVGRSTAQAVLHGGWMGVVYELEGLYNRLVNDGEPPTVLLTGGDADLLAVQLRMPVTVDRHLVLRGLYQILSDYYA